ncbi:MAG: LysR family transcriptional regulator [Rhodospirillales bacterium]|nr:LysR family transcriptional regulator [Rhodospirillales bacterium]
MSIRFDLLTLEVFIAIVEEQGIARAAERRRIAASAISRRISDMEAMLGVDLFIRHAKGMDLTPAGAALLRHARGLRAAMAQMEAELSEHRQGLRGLVRIVANKSAILQFLPEDLVTFLDRYPLVQVELEEGTSPGIVRAVADNAADLGIYGGNIPAPDLAVRRYRQDRLVAVMPRGHALAGNPSLRFAALVEHDFVCLEHGSSIETLCLRAAEALDRALRPRVRVSGFDALFRMVETGLGVGVVPERVVAESGRLERLIAVPLTEDWTLRPLNLCMRAPTALPPAVRLLAEHLTPSE